MHPCKFNHESVTKPKGLQPWTRLLPFAGALCVGDSLSGKAAGFTDNTQDSCRIPLLGFDLGDSPENVSPSTPLRSWSQECAIIPATFAFRRGHNSVAWLDQTDAPMDGQTDSQRALLEWPQVSEQKTYSKKKNQITWCRTLEEPSLIRLWGRATRDGNEKNAGSRGVCSCEAHIIPLVLINSCAGCLAARYWQTYYIS